MMQATPVMQVTPSYGNWPLQNLINKIFSTPILILVPFQVIYVTQSQTIWLNFVFFLLLSHVGLEIMVLSFIKTGQNLIRKILLSITLILTGTNYLRGLALTLINALMFSMTKSKS